MPRLVRHASVNQPFPRSDRPDLHPPRTCSSSRKSCRDAGFDTWTVGGAVRDALAGGQPGDWDLTTAARPPRRAAPLSPHRPRGHRARHGGGAGQGRAFVRGDDLPSRRGDGWPPRARHLRRPVDDDLERRDFTINAVAWHPITRELRDPHGGLAGLRDGILRTVGDPAERFREDRLRVLRALRFAGRFGLRIDRRRGRRRGTRRRSWCTFPPSAFARSC